MVSTITSQLQLSSLNEPLIPHQQFIPLSQPIPKDQDQKSDIATMTTVLNESKENHPGATEVVTGMSTPEKLIARGYDTITAPAKKRCRVNSIPLSAIPVWRPEPSNIWTKVTKEYRSSSRECAAPYARAGSKRRHPDHPTCPCKRPLLDFSKMCETSYHKVNVKRDSIIIPKGVGLDIVALCEEPDAFSIRPILECDNSSLYLVNKTSPSSINIDLDSMERD